MNLFGNFNRLLKRFRRLSCFIAGSRSCRQVTSRNARIALVQLAFYKSFSGPYSATWLHRCVPVVHRDKKSEARRRRAGSRSIEALEFRQLLSASVVTIETPNDVSFKNPPGNAPATSASPTGFTPAQVRQAYGIDQIFFGNGVSGNGAGTTIAIVDAYDDPNIAHDLHQFDLAFGLPDPTLIKVNQYGGTVLPSANSVWITEIALDVEWAHAVAPGANILLVEAKSASDTDLFSAVDYARRVPGVVTVSMSWGSSEFTAETTFDSDFLTPAGHTGVSFVVSSGDTGSPVSYPSSSPNVVSVGGTTLNASQGNYSGESAWAGSGGGVSVIEPQPSYQKGVVTQSTTKRTNPDVAYDSNPNTGFPVYDSFNDGNLSPWGQWGGTSDAAPQWAALVAIADQGRAIAGLRSLDGRTQLLPELYQLPSTDFHDVAAGTSTGTPHFTAAVGYDLVTGRGTPVANLLVPHLAGQSDLTAATHFSISAPTSAVSGTQFSITITALDSSNSVSAQYRGTVQFTSTDLAQGITLPANYTFTSADNGVHRFTSLSLLTPGAQSILVRDATKGTIAGSAILSVTDFGPFLTGTSSMTYVKNQAATVVNPTILLTDNTDKVLSSATVSVSNALPAEDQLSFLNTSAIQFGNITSVFDHVTGTLSLLSVGSMATIAQFQSALRAVTYFDQGGNDTQLGNRSVTFQVSNGTKNSNVVASTITISDPTTTTTLSTSTVASVVGQSITLTASVAVVKPGTGIPTAGMSTASVSFFDGTTLIPGTVTYGSLSGVLIATLTTTSLTSGTHSISAGYSGDLNYQSSRSPALRQTVSRAATTLSVSTSMPSAISGQSVTITATIGVASPGSGTPTAGIGTPNVVFLDGRYSVVGTVTYSYSNGNLLATLTTSRLAIGQHAISAAYSGDVNFQSGVSAALQQTITRPATNIVVTTSNPAPIFGTSLTMTAVISVVDPGTSTAMPKAGTASVTFLDSGTAIFGPVTFSNVNGNLVATLTTSRLSAGSRVITAIYSGDSNFQGSTSAVLNQMIVKSPTTLSLSSSKSSKIYGQSVTFSAAIGVVDLGYGLPTAGTGNTNVTFLDGNNPISGNVTYSLSKWTLVATLTTSGLTAGSHSIAAIYSGDSNFQGSASAAVSAIVSRAATTLAVSSSIPTAYVGQSVTLTATVSVVDPGSGTATAGMGNANITFFDGANPISGTIVYSVVKGKLVATLTVSGLSIGAHVITAMYSGDSNFQGSTSAASRQAIIRTV